MNETQVDLRSWIGRSQTLHDTVTPTPVIALEATLDHAAPAAETGRPLPPLWHWLYFLPLHRQSEIGEDGHPKRGGFLPPVPLPRRMWAGSQFEFRSPIRVGDRIERTSTIDDVTCKEGRSGKLKEGTTNKASTVGKVTGVEKKTGPAGPMMVFTVTVTEGKFSGRDFDLYVSFSPKARFKLVESYNALGLPLDGPWGKSKAVGVYVGVNLIDEEFNDQWSAKIKSIFKHPKGVGYRGAATLPA